MKLRAERKAGEMLGRLEKGQKAGLKKGPRRSMLDNGPSEYSKVLKDTDTSR